MTEDRANPLSSKAPAKALYPLLGGGYGFFRDLARTTPAYGVGRKKIKKIRAKTRGFLGLQRVIFSVLLALVLAVG
jgi:hypothetical protein